MSAKWSLGSVRCLGTLSIVPKMLEGSMIRSNSVYVGVTRKPLGLTSPMTRRRPLRAIESPRSGHAGIRPFLRPLTTNGPLHGASLAQP